MIHSVASTAQPRGQQSRLLKTIFRPPSPSPAPSLPSLPHPCSLPLSSLLPFVVAVCRLITGHTWDLWLENSPWRGIHRVVLSSERALLQRWNEHTCFPLCLRFSRVFKYILQIVSMHSISWCCCCTVFSCQGYPVPWLHAVAWVLIQAQLVLSFVFSHVLLVMAGS